MSRAYQFLYALAAGAFAFLLLVLFLPYGADWGRRVSANFISGLVPGVTDPYISAWVLTAVVFTVVFAILSFALVVSMRRTDGHTLVDVVAVLLNFLPSLYFGYYMHRVFQGEFVLGPIRGEAIAPTHINVSYFVSTIVLPGMWYLAICMFALVMRPRTSVLLVLLTFIGTIWPVAEIARIWFLWINSGSEWQPNLLRDQAMIVWFWVEVVDILMLAAAFMLSQRSAVVESGVAAHAH